MLVRWTQGTDHGLVWDHGLAVVAGAVSPTAARGLWAEFADGGDLAAFLKALSAGTGSDLLSLPDFAIALRSSGGWQLAARGALEVRVGDEAVRGAGISTWAERSVQGAGPVSVGAPDAAGEVRPIVAGLVPAAALTLDGAAEPAPLRGFSLVPKDAPEATAPDRPSSLVDLRTPIGSSAADAPPAPESPALDSIQDATRAPEPEPAPTPGQLAPPLAPDESAPDEPAPIAASEEPAAAAGSGPESAPVGGIGQGRFARQFGETLAFAVEDAAVREVAPDVFISGVPRLGADDEGDHDGHTMLAPPDLGPAGASPAPAADPASDGPLVLGLICANGHAGPPQRSSCTVCGAPFVGEPGRVARPSLGTVLLPNGERIELTDPVIVGRNPRADRVPGAAVPRLVPLSQGHISGTHLALRLEDWNVLAVDLNSTNGTYLRRRGEAPVRLGERPELLIEGDVLDLGHGVQLVLEALR